MAVIFSQKKKKKSASLFHVRYELAQPFVTNKIIFYLQSYLKRVVFVKGREAGDINPVQVFTTKRVEEKKRDIKVKLGGKRKVKKELEGQNHKCCIVTKSVPRQISLIVLGFGVLLVQIECAGIISWDHECAIKSKSMSGLWRGE